MKSLKQIHTEVIQSFQKISFKGNPENLYEPLNYIMSIGGKRIRPLLSVLICEIMNGNTEAALKAGQAIEVFHNFSLIHDDIMDAADLRRSQATVHKKWDMPNAILSGDLMLVKSIEIMLELPAESKSECLKILLETASKVCEGQQFDMNFERKNDVQLEEYIEMIRLKTAVLLGCSFWCGTYIATQNKNIANQFYDYGCNVGIGFQIWDDYLDTFGETAAVGKRIGGDILANKKTYLLLKALEIANENQKEIIFQNYNSPTVYEEEKIKTITDLFYELNIDKIAQKAMEDYFEKAAHILKEFPQYNFTILNELVDSLTTRNH